MKRNFLAPFFLAAALASFSYAQDAADFDQEVKQDERTAQGLEQEKNASDSKVIKKLGGDAAVQSGLVRMETVRASGAVLFYILNGKKAYPALSVRECGQGNYFSVFSRAKEYKMNKAGHAGYSYSVGENSIVETITMKGVAEIKASYEIGKSSPKEKRADSIKVKVQLKNLSGRDGVLALKAVYNLCLGENRKAHFSTPLKNEVSSEYVIFPSNEESWIISSDSQNAVELVLYGNGVTPPKKAVAANKDVIELSTPVTLFTPGNSFDSLMSYNDSSLALFWEPAALKADETVSYSYILNFSDNGFQNSARESESKAEPAQAAAEKPQEPVEETVVESAQAQVVEEKVEAASQAADSSSPNLEYVQQLINHINSLEQSDPSLNRLKIQQLQTEVDEVLKFLRSR